MAPAFGFTLAADTTNLVPFADVGIVFADLRSASTIVLLVCGCLSSTAFLSAADWMWNPFKSRTEKRPEPTVPVRTSQVNTLRSPLLYDDTRQVSATRTSYSKPAAPERPDESARLPA